jgi:hypothetical protein
MSQMQRASSSHNYLWTNHLCISLNHTLVHLSCHSITKTLFSSSHNYLWTNHLCISLNHTLVHLSCHSITKTKQGPSEGTSRFQQCQTKYARDLKSRFSLSWEIYIVNLLSTLLLTGKLQAATAKFELPLWSSFSWVCTYASFCVWYISCSRGTYAPKFAQFSVNRYWFSIAILYP